MREDFAGSHLDAITKVSFEGKELEKMVSSGGTKISIFLTREVTAKPGTVSLVLESDRGPQLSANVRIDER